MTGFDALCVIMSLKSVCIWPVFAGYTLTNLSFEIELVAQRKVRHCAT